ncbi:hypothetical protein SD37_09825 [Amycolatopsis orientalis]|uniref:Haloacid dehalogenase n=1 Tax=Amycolatopsis orientalis TaxID=31958 RepID=A0A193BUK9_AMYOR|nr:HAD family hydrolase [Amycolatopsis orientalis]ANN15911.1 hypothetical protein SD37_09825 [Amycolatopsis orientalis]
MTDSLQDVLAAHAVVIFDLDGVLVDSNEMKAQCIRATFAAFPEELVGEFVEEFRRTFGRSRREHFSWFHSRSIRHGLAEANAEEFYLTYAGIYANLLATSYPRAPLCAHADRLVIRLSTRGVPLHVATGTLTAEANAVLKHAGLGAAFHSVLGGEEPKARRIEQILATSGVAPGEAVLLGDTRQDALAADEAGCDFVLVSRYGFFPPEEVLRGRAGRDDLVVADLDPDAPVPPRGRHTPGRA